MQVETKNQAPVTEIKPNLRVAAVSNEKSSLSFFYIGSNNECIKALSHSFRTGLIAESFEAARKLILCEDQDAPSVDVFFIDIAFDEKALRQFQQFLTVTAGISPVTPIIYHEQHIKDAPRASYLHLVDDVIDIARWHFGFSSKINFLKEARLHAAREEAQRIKASYCIYKRSFDIIVSSLLILAALPVMLLIALVIKLESKGPIIYNAKRAGRGFRVFPFYKFRTMVVNADKKIQDLAHLNQYTDSNGPKFFKIANDPRITRVGKFLRNSSLDELPQLFNVLKGDMSLVGNRPLPLYEAATLTTNEFVERFMAPAGITGLWQIKKRGKADMSTEERISLDISYARRSNLMYDLWIMANTPKALLQKSDV